MQKKITSMWQDYETHLFTCEHCQTKTLGKDLVHDYDASALVLPLDCPSCERRVALLTIEARIEEIQKFASQGYKSAIEHLATTGRYYESWPNFTQGDTDDEAASRIAHSIEFMSDTKLGQDAVQFMLTVAHGIGFATEETPFIFESEPDEDKYYQLIRGTDGEYYSELSSPDAVGKPADEKQRAALEPLGWTMPNEDSPNYHREYAKDADVYEVAADAVRGWFAS